MPTSGSSSRSSAIRCSAERPWMPKASRSPRTRCTRLSALTRPSALPRSDISTRPVWHGSSRASSRSITWSSYSSSRSSPVTSSSFMPVQPASDSWICSPRYSAASRPTADALMRSGRSLEIRMTSLPSLARLRATARMRVSLSPSRKPEGSESGSVWFSSTRTVPPSSPTGTGSSRRPFCDAQLVEHPQGRAREVPELGVVPLALQLGDHHDRQDDLVLCEPFHRPRVGQQDRGVEDVRPSSGRG